ncbi:histone H3-like centromeric protein cid [Drosophila busckii]|uniref:histone H3-like centromeric protein cid n=1 Tax=Drosophila busckii TaxID=30019 RepID=UPI00083EA88F|nr:histone H3-like centromeric protein cid [Drosophila busckii]
MGRRKLPAPKATAKPKPRQPQPPSDDEISDDGLTFRTPERQNTTDYGLEFTTSRLAELNTSPRTRRCSTMRKQQQVTQTSLEDNEDVENRPPSSPTPPAHTSPQRQGQRQQTQNSNAAAAGSRRRRQMRPERRDAKMMREMMRLQANPGFLIPRLSFARVVREVLSIYNISSITLTGMEALQTASEMYVTQRFQDANMLTLFRKRVTLEVRDMAMVAYFCRAHGYL